MMRYVRMWLGLRGIGCIISGNFYIFVGDLGLGRIIDLWFIIIGDS